MTVAIRSGRPLWPILVLGLVLAPVVAFVAVKAIGSAWSACGDFEPPYGFALLFGTFPIVSLVVGAVWLILIYATRRVALTLSLPIAFSAVLLVGWISVATAVPMERPGYYNDPMNPPAEAIPGQCGPNGIPTWWPGWLPV